MRFGLSATLSRVATNIKTFGVKFLKDNLKIFFDFKNTDLEHVGTGSANFSGGSQSLVIPTAVLDNAAAFTIMAWAKKAALGDADGLVICGNASSGFYYRSVNKISITASVALDGSNAVVTTSTFDDTTDWMHFALTYDGSTIKSYVNGKSQATSTSGSGIVTSGSTINRIGEYGSAYHHGKLKNFAVWHRALNASEIQNVMFKTYSELQGSELTHLQSWYALESSTLSGSDATGNNDITSNLNSVTFTDSIYGGNTPTKPRGADNSSAALPDQIGNGSTSFDGTDDYVNCGDADNLSFGNESSDSAFSWSAWIKFPSGITDSNFIISKDNSSNVEYQLFLNTDFKINARCHDGALEKQRGLTGTTVLSANTWHHIAWTYDGTGGDNAQSGMNIYLNGALEAVSAEIDASSYTAMHSTSAPLYIGLTDRISDKTFKGNIAQVGLWSRVLTQEEIQSINQKQYSELTTSEKTNIVSWWGLDEVFLGSNTNTNSLSSTRYETGQIVEDKAGTLSTILVDNYDNLDNWEASNANGSLSRNADGNLVITASGGSARANLKSSVVTLETDTMYLAELAVAGGTDTSIYLRLDDEDYGATKYANGYLTPNSAASNTDPECMSVRFKSDSSNTGFYAQIGNIDDTKTAIIKSFKLYKIVSGNYGVLTDA